VKLTLKNQDEMPHNWVLIQPTGDKGLALAQKAWLLGEKGPEKEWLPEDERILVASKLVEPHQSQELSFKAPDQPGKYVYVCTFPGHAMSMNGVLEVVQEGKLLEDLTYALYLGSWERLPDFSALKPHRQGALPAGKVGWKFDDYKNQFGCVFRGRLSVEKKALYRFYLASDDGARLWVDRKQVIDNDGIHPSDDVKTGLMELAPGSHTVELHYFEQAGDEQLYLAWSGPGFTETPLSTWLHPKAGDSGPKRARDRGPSIVIGPENGRPVIHRNFFRKTSSRGIAVGYAGGSNVIFDAERLGLSQFWRGAFMDVGRHWSDRGAGQTQPLGYAVVQPAGESIFWAQVKTEEAAWPETSKNNLERQYTGYRLDPMGFPTFEYRLQGLKVEETYVPPSDGSAADATLTRILNLQGDIPVGLHLKLAEGQITEAAGIWHVEDAWTLHATAPAQLLEHKRLVLPISKPGEIRIQYRWK
jgi:plastocyanin